MDGCSRLSDRSHSVRYRGWLVVPFLLASACTSAVGSAPPLPFPGATPPPSSAGGTPAYPEAPAPSATAMAVAVVDTALSYQGIPYVLGGENPTTGFDCSGLVQFVLAQYAIAVPRLVGDQFREGLPVKLKDLRAGDLVFFSTTGPGPTHVGIAIDRDRFVHAPNSRGVVRVEAVDTPYWHDRFVGARRLF